MNEVEHSEATFKRAVNWFSLKFKDCGMEKSFRRYKIYEKKIPLWFKWLMGSLIIIIMFRKIELLIFSLLKIEGNVLAFRDELILNSVIICALIVEIVILYCEPLAPAKGFSIMLAAFFLISYNSRMLYPTQLALIPLYCTLLSYRSMPVLISCAFLCYYYIHSWIVGAVASIIGAIMSTSLMSSNNFPICIMKY